jgi:hypothetical protein
MHGFLSLRIEIDAFLRTQCSQLTYSEDLAPKGEPVTLFRSQAEPIITHLGDRVAMRPHL